MTKTLTGKLEIERRQTSYDVERFTMESLILAQDER